MRNSLWVFQVRYPAMYFPARPPFYYLWTLLNLSFLGILVTCQQATIGSDLMQRLIHGYHRVENLPINFRYHGFADPQLTATQQGVLDMIQLAQHGLSSASASSSTFLRYFQKEDLDSVTHVYDKILAESAYAEFPEIHFIDIYFEAWEHLAPQTSKCNEKANLLAVAIEGVVTPEDKNIILCSELFARNAERSLSDIRCESLEQQATWSSMDTVGASILHEMLHLEGLMGRSIDDVSVTVAGPGEIPGYGPYGAMMVNRIDKLGILNADNYVWFALEAYFMVVCDMDAFTNPSYEKVEVEL